MVITGDGAVVGRDGTVVGGGGMTRQGGESCCCGVSMKAPAAQRHACMSTDHTECGRVVLWCGSFWLEWGADVLCHPWGVKGRHEGQQHGGLRRRTRKAKGLAIDHLGCSTANILVWIPRRTSGSLLNQLVELSLALRDAFTCRWKRSTSH